MTHDQLRHLTAKEKAVSRAYYAIFMIATAVLITL